MNLPKPPPIGKGNSLFYALLVAGFLAFQSIHISYNQTNGFEIRSQQVPLQLVAPCLVFMAAALGINLLDTLDKLTQLLVELAKVVNRNSSRLDDLEPEHIKTLIDEAVEEALEEKSNNQPPPQL